MQKNRWIVTSMFAWCLAGSVALAVYSGRPNLPAEAATRVDLVPDNESSQTPTVGTPGVGNPGINKPGIEQASPKKKPGPTLKAIQWEPSFESAMKKARATGKPVMIDFYTDWCHWCKVLDSDVYPDKTVVAESAKWISVKVNAEKRTDLARAYGVTGFPTIAFVEGNGKPFDNIPGFAPMPEFLNLMRAAYAKRNPVSRA